MISTNEPLKKRELFFLFATVIPALKLIFLPEYAAIALGRDSWLIFVVTGAVDVLFSFFIIYATKWNLSSAFSVNKLPAKIIGFLFIAVLGCKSLMYFRQTLEFVFTSTYTFEPLKYFAIPLIALEVCIQFTDIRNQVRLSSIIFPLMIMTYLILIITGIMNFDSVRVRPVLDYGINPLLKSIPGFFTWTGDCILLFLLLPYSENPAEKRYRFTSGIIFGNIIASLLCFIFIGVFGDIAGFVTLSVTELPVFAGSEAVFADFDSAVRIIWTFALFISDTLYLFLTVTVFNRVFGVKNEKVTKIILPSALCLASLFLFENEEYYMAFGIGIASVILGIVQYSSMFAAGIYLSIKNRRSNKRYEAA